TFRAGLPSEPGAKVELVGRTDRTLPSEYLEGGFRELIGPKGFAGAMAWWRSTLLPSPRATRLFEVPDPITPVRADLPGGIGTLIKESDHVGNHRGAAAGWLFPLPHSAIEIAGELVGGTTVTARDLTDAGLLDHCLSLGVLRASD
ncbi:MAG: hypothetical protein KDB26_07025, partial [Microthrixaceae bacterium]|nr:hypothetical protein [Microthrixaceae bacterium]